MHLTSLELTFHIVTNSVRAADSASKFNLTTTLCWCPFHLDFISTKPGVSSLLPAQAGACDPARAVGWKSPLPPGTSCLHSLCSVRSARPSLQISDLSAVREEKTWWNRLHTRGENCREDGQPSAALHHWSPMLDRTSACLHMPNLVRGPFIAIPCPKQKKINL